MAKKDYLKIILNGFIKNHEYLTEYFIREYKKAKRKDYAFGEFFKGCLKVLSTLDLDVKKQYYAEKKEIQGWLKDAISTNNIEDEKICREQLNELKECNYPVNLYRFSGGKFIGNLDCEDIKYIALSLGVAIERVSKQTTDTPNPEQMIKRKNPTIEEDIKTALEIIEPLKGYWNRKPILTDTDFNRLKKYIESIIRNDSLPEPAEPFARTGATNDFIRKTIYEVYQLTGKKNRPFFIDLIHLFRQFGDTEPTTTDRKFSNYPGNYINDKETLITF